MGMDKTVSLGWLFVPFVVLVLIASTNAVNITDGLDGLAAGVTLIVTVFFTNSGNDQKRVGIHKNVFGHGCREDVWVFLTFNAYPARIFMGDTGSLALGGAGRCNCNFDENASHTVDCRRYLRC